MDIIFSSERMDFIRPSEEFVYEYMMLMNNPDVYGFLTDNENNFSLEDEAEWVRRHQDDYTFTFINRETGEFIGNGGFNEIESGSGEIGIVITPTCQNNHYGTEAIEALIQFGFEVLNLREITLIVYSHNERAIHCYSNVGFEEYHRVSNVRTVNGEEIDDIYMRLRR